MNAQYVIRRTMIVFLFVELLFFTILYCFGPKSIKVLYDMYEQENNVHEEIHMLSRDIAQLEQEIQQSVTLFAKEKIAREKLLMKKEKELVFLTAK